METTVATFERDGYAVLDFAQLPDDTVASFLASLEPWADTQMAANGSQPATLADPDRYVDRWTREQGFDSYWQGHNRIAANNAVLQLAAHGDTANLALNLMLQKELIRFAALAFRTQVEKQSDSFI